MQYNKKNDTLQSASVDFVHPMTGHELYEMLLQLQEETGNYSITLPCYIEKNQERGWIKAGKVMNKRKDAKTQKKSLINTNNPLKKLFLSDVFYLVNVVEED